MENAKGPAYCLAGRQLEGGWTVEEILPLVPGGTGGNFSVGYLVERDGTMAFLKALDFSRMFSRPNTMKMIEAMVRNYNFEQEVSYHCLDRRMTKVVHPVGHGQVLVEGFPVPDVYYIIYELADGDSRHALSTLEQGVTAWKLRTLHDVAVGLRQLHAAEVAHQDVKPSNVMCFELGGSKIGDLGQASRRDRPRPLDDCAMPGDPVYAPPEQRYGEVPSDWVKRRYGCDAYHLGSLALFFFAGVSMTAAIDERLDPAHRLGAWDGGFEMVLPFLIDAWDQVMRDAEESLERSLPEFGLGLAGMVRQLTHPDPERRGHPKALGRTNPYSLDRYVAQLDLMSRQAELRGL